MTDEAEKLVPVVWLCIPRNFKFADRNNASKARKLTLRTASHEVPLAESFADELMRPAIEALDTHKTLRGLESLVSEVLKRQVLEVVAKGVDAIDTKKSLHRLKVIVEGILEEQVESLIAQSRDQIKESWSQRERINRMRADWHRKIWTIPETDAAVERPERPPTE